VEWFRAKLLLRFTSKTVMRFTTQYVLHYATQMVNQFQKFLQKGCNAYISVDSFVENVYLFCAFFCIFLFPVLRDAVISFSFNVLLSS
jgi:hypothetical protein